MYVCMYIYIYMMNSVPLFYFFFWWFVLSVVVSEDALAPSATTTTTTTTTTSQLQQNLEWYKTCGTPFSCGNLTGIGFPFWGGNRPHTCGYPGFNLTCTSSTNSKNKTISTTTISIKGLTYRVLSIDQIDQTVTLARQDLTADICVDRFANTTLDSSLYDYALGSQNMSLLYGCTETYENGYGSANIPGKFQCSVNGTSNVDGYVLTGAMGPTSGCYASVVVPTLGLLAAQLQAGSLTLEEVISEGFQVKYKVGGDDDCRICNQSEGRCGYDLKATVCLCSDGRVESETCSQSDFTSKTSSLLTEGKRPHSKTVIGISIGVGLGVAVLFVGVWSLIRRRGGGRRRSTIRNAKASPHDHNGNDNKDLLIFSGSKSNGTTTPSSGQGLMASSSPSTFYSHSQSDQYSYSYASYSTTTTTTRSTSDVYFGVRVFSYAELEQATDNFDDERELGDGGYGTVYYGQLPDGHPIAVKRLYENSLRRVEQFMNEIEILARLRHDHLVTLYGCNSRRSRELLLVYEYVPNGTVADHLHHHHHHGNGNGSSSSNNLFLPWSTRLNIAVQTADALAYLHRSEIVHRDVKTANILLDQRFRVKVADFGLSKLYPNDVTHVSTAPRGTPGYVDPEYHQCYRLTEKSDVYSFGVVLVELLSSKQAVDITRHRHDINLSNMAVDRIRKGALGELVDTRLGFGGGVDPEVDREIKVVAELAFRCLQQDRDDRPSMEEVFRGLKSLLSTSQAQTQSQTIHEVEEAVKIVCQSDDIHDDHHQLYTSAGSDSTNFYRHTIE